ncbi:hypothetical protein KUV38_05815 [Vannielia litorea]|uniref:hypothetical protein n=2 Tax=Vannielia litorea TaxID=1217970 RepID=UPI001C949970|nr:hypothetical protein [Vannielia litorea]MBY6047153.1 hypothetical protein [Vannielia litorea]
MSLVMPQQVAAQVRLETAGRIAIDAVKALGPKQKAELASFRRSYDYYGALYVSTTGDVAYGHAGASSMAAAQTIARMGCERKAQARCVPHAVIAPRSVNEGPNGRFDNSGTLANVMVDRFNKLQRGRWTAFAAAPEGAWGAATNLPRGSQAEAHALGQCRSSAAKARRSYPAAMARAMDRRGLFRCRTALVLEK